MDAKSSWIVACVVPGGTRTTARNHCGRTHHRHVVGVHDHGEATDLIAGEGDRIGGGHEDSAGDPDGAGVFPDAETEKELRGARATRRRP
jgi:hypothetical protein